LLRDVNAVSRLQGTAFFIGHDETIPAVAVSQYSLGVNIDDFNAHDRVVTQPRQLEHNVALVEPPLIEGCWRAPPTRSKLPPTDDGLRLEFARQPRDQGP
jgi:hypothetical protein